MTWTPPARRDGIGQIRDLVLRMGFSQSALDDFVSLGADRDMRFCAVRATDGMWDVYYTERGQKDPTRSTRVSTTRGVAYMLAGFLAGGALFEQVDRNLREGALPRGDVGNADVSGSDPISITTAKLQELGLSQDAYSFGGLKEDAWCAVRISPDNEWEVFYLRSSARQNPTRALGESAACFILAGELGWGALPEFRAAS